ncbi:MAG: hypothetical protein LQ352_002131 [Teloschistes flavicans]|nr:MAG: hypothetical protein LQ352_002131 [Teloschistes flavicans]
MQLSSTAYSLTIFLLISTFSRALSFPQSLDPRDDICDPEKCNGAFEDNDGDPSYACEAPSKRFLLRDIHLTKRETACIALGTCPGTNPPQAQLLNCKNCEKIKTAKEKFKGNCDPANSKGFKSSHNCEGSSYLCVHDGVAQELAVAGILDEISNAEDGEAIGRYITNAGAVGGGKVTKKAVLFVVYQTGRDGPQNGFRVALVKEGVPVESAIQQLKGEVVQNAAEYVVVRKI